MSVSHRVTLNVGNIEARQIAKLGTWWHEASLTSLFRSTAVPRRTDKDSNCNSNVKHLSSLAGGMASSLQGTQRFTRAAKIVQSSASSFIRLILRVSNRKMTDAVAMTKNTMPNPSVTEKSWFGMLCLVVK